MVNDSLRLKADFLLEQVEAIESSNREMSRASRQADALDLDEIYREVLEEDSSNNHKCCCLRNREIIEEHGRIEGITPHDGNPSECGAATSDGVEPHNLSPQPSPRVSADTVVGFRGQSFDESLPRRCLMAMKVQASNSRLKQRKLEAEVLYLRRALHQAEAEKTSLEIRLISMERSSSSADAPQTSQRGSIPKDDDLKLEKYLNSLLVSRNQALQENHLLRSQLLETCDDCYDRLGRVNPNTDISARNKQVQPPTWRNAAQQVVRDITGSVHDEKKAHELSRNDPTGDSQTSSVKAKGIIETAMATLDRNSSRQSYRSFSDRSSLGGSTESFGSASGSAKSNGSLFPARGRASSASTANSREAMKTAMSKLEKHSKHAKDKLKPVEHPPRKISPTTRDGEGALKSVDSSNRKMAKIYIENTPPALASHHRKTPPRTSKPRKQKVYLIEVSATSDISISSGEETPMRLHKKSKPSLELQTNVLMNFHEKNRIHRSPSMPLPHSPGADRWH